MLKLLALAGLGYAGYRYYQKTSAGTGPVAFAGNQGDARIRDAGPEAMRSDVTDWRKEDEESDQSFPASDPPANY